jgi:hypothetical protein
LSDQERSGTIRKRTHIGNLTDDRQSAGLHDVFMKTHRFRSQAFVRLPVALALLVVGQAGLITAQAAPVKDFSLVVAPATITLTPGGTATVRVTVARTGAFNAAVKFGVINPLNGVKVKVSKPSKAGVTLTLSALANAPSQSGQMTVTGNGGGKRRQTPFAVVVGNAPVPTTGVTPLTAPTTQVAPSTVKTTPPTTTPPTTTPLTTTPPTTLPASTVAVPSAPPVVGDFSVAFADGTFLVTPNEVAEWTGGSRAATVNIQRIGGYAGKPKLTIENLPPNVQYTFIDTGAVVGFQQLNLTIASNAIPGRYPVALVATDGLVVKRVLFNFRILRNGQYTPGFEPPTGGPFYAGGGVLAPSALIDLAAGQSERPDVLVGLLINGKTVVQSYTSSREVLNYTLPAGLIPADKEFEGLKYTVTFTTPAQQEIRSGTVTYCNSPYVSFANSMATANTGADVVFPFLRFNVEGLVAPTYAAEIVKARYDGVAYTGLEGLSASIVDAGSASLPAKRYSVLMKSQAGVTTAKSVYVKFTATSGPFVTTRFLQVTLL